MPSDRAIRLVKDDVLCNIPHLFMDINRQPAMPNSRNTKRVMIFKTVYRYSQPHSTDRLMNIKYNM